MPGFFYQKCDAGYTELMEIIMNKRIGLFVLLLLVAVVCISCTGKKSNDVMQFRNRPEIITYKAADSGEGIPDWVIEAANGNTKTVKEAFNLEGKKVWILQDDIATTASDNTYDLYPLIRDVFYDIRGQIYSSVISVISELRDSSSSSDSEHIIYVTTEDQYKNYWLSEINYPLSGIEFVDDCWTKTRTLKDGLKKAESDDDYDYRYTYLCVFAMDEDMYIQHIMDLMQL